VTVASLPLQDIYIALNPTYGGTTLTTAHSQNPAGISTLVTAVASSGTTVTYTANNSFTVGELVTVTGISIPGVDVVDIAIASRTSTQFVINYASPAGAFSTVSVSGIASVSNAYWTNITRYVQEWSLRSGKQHYLDRMEAGTVSITLNNRDGQFWNTYKIGVRQPIAIQATWPQTSGTTYPVFFGFIDSIEEKIIDQLNSEVVITASDSLKYLSLRYMASSTLWPSYANPSGGHTQNWYRLDTTPSATVTEAQAYGSSHPSYILYTGVNNFQANQNVTVSGLNINTGSNLNVQNGTIVASPAPTATTFVVDCGVAIASGSTSNGSGVAYLTSANDLVGSSKGSLGGSVAFQQYGAMVYDTDNCVDLANGGAAGTGWLQMPQFTGIGSVDFWVLGQGLAASGAYNTLIFAVSGFYVWVNINGQVVVTKTYSGAPFATGTIAINDGYWHHIGLVGGAGGNVRLYVDGTFTAISGSSTNTFSTPSPWFIGYDSTKSLPTLPAYLDEVVIGSSSVTDAEILNRYRAGTLLQLGAPATAQNIETTGTNQVSSGDRIAEILCVAGYGSIVNGALTLNSNTFYVNESSTPWAIGSGNGYTYTEPFYWDTPVTTSTALDLILQICDTDIGTFWQRPDGSFNFNNQNFYGTWSWNSSTNTGTWAPTYAAATASHTFSDAGTNTQYATAAVAPYYGPSTQVLYDDTDLWTLVKVTPQSGTPQVYEKTSSEAQYGVTVLEKSSTLHGTLNLALSTATYLGYLYGTPKARVQQVELRSENSNGIVGGDGIYNVSLLKVALGDVVSFTRSYPGTSTPFTANFVVESIAHQVDAATATWHTTYVLDPYPLGG